MASRKEYLEFILGQLSGLYYRGKLFGGIYDDRLLVKPVKAALDRMPDAPRELPYPGAKPMLLVEEVDRKEFLTELIQAMEPELPAPKRRRKPDAFSL